MQITISDKGIGIAANDMQQIFEPFFRSADAMARKRKGTGIGLTITRYIMQAHGGDVTVASRPGQGSTFTLLLPRATHTHHPRWGWRRLVFRRLSSMPRHPGARPLRRHAHPLDSVRPPDASTDQTTERCA